MRHIVRASAAFRFVFATTLQLYVRPRSIRIPPYSPRADPSLSPEIVSRFRRRPNSWRSMCPRRDTSRSCRVLESADADVKNTLASSFALMNAKAPANNHTSFGRWMDNNSTVSFPATSDE